MGGTCWPRLLTAAPNSRRTDFAANFVLVRTRTLSSSVTPKLFKLQQVWCGRASRNERDAMRLNRDKRRSVRQNTCKSVHLLSTLVRQHTKKSLSFQ